MSELEQGIVLYEQKKYREAIVIFEKFEYKDVKATNYLGLCYTYLYDFDKATHIFHQGWMCFEDGVFIDNLIYCAYDFYNKGNSGYNPAVHYLNSYLMVQWNDYKRAKVYYVLGFCADKEPFNEKETLYYFENAVELEPNNEFYKKGLEYIKEKIENGILGSKFTIKPEILAILDRLKKPCQAIIKDRSLEVETEEDEPFHIFSINNHEGIHFPKEIKRLEVYFDDDAYETTYKILDNYGIDQEKNMEIENSFNLPDLMTLEKLYPEDYKTITDYFLTLNEKENHSLAYSQLIEKYLGHPLHSSFIGGNLNMKYVELYDFEKLNFLMQYLTPFGNGEIVFVFNTLENPTDLTIMIEH